MFRRLAKAMCALLAASLLSGCLDPTQIEVELTTDVNCADHPQTTISVGPLGQSESSPPVAVTTACAPKTGRIGSIVVLPHDSKEGQVGIEVVAGLAKSADECRRDNFVGGCIVARRSLNFVKHHSLELPIELEAACVDVPCGATETCRKGSCVSAQVDPDSCLTNQGCSIADPNGGSGGIGGAGGDEVGGTGSGGAGAVGGTSSDSGAGAGGPSGDGGQASASGGSAGQASGGGGGQLATGGQSGTAGQTSAGFGGQAAAGSAGETAAGNGGQAAGGAAGQGSGGSGGEVAGGAAGTGGAPQLGPVLVASDFKASAGNVSTLSPTKALLPEHPGDILFAWVCITSQLGSATPQDSKFWTAYTNAPGMTLLLAQVRCQVFTATATGGSESHAFNVFPASAASIQRLELAAAKPPPPSPPSDSALPITTPTTSAMTVSQNHSAIVYFFGVSGSTTLGAIKIGVGGVSTPMQQISGGGLSQLTSGIAVAYDQPSGTAPKVSYFPANASVWSSAGVVISPNP